MNREQLDALFALHKAFPGEWHWVDEFGNLIYQIPLTDEQQNFFSLGAQMMAPID